MEDISLPVAFSAGLLSFLSPCVLPLVPAYIATIAGTSAIDSRVKTHWPALFHALSFVVGFSLIFIALGASIGTIGATLSAHMNLLLKVGGALVIVFGLFLIASLRLPWLNYEKRFTYSSSSGTSYLRSLLVGAAFSLAWTPCVGPVLGSILTLALGSQTAWQGAYLLAVYSLGLGVPFILVGLGWGTIMPRLRLLTQHLNIVSIISGILLVAVGVLIVTNRFALG